MEAQTIIQELERSASGLAETGLDALIAKIKASRRVFVCGTGRSGLMLKAFAMRLMQLGLTSYVVGETTTPSIGKGDLLIVASASGETASVCMTAQSALKQGAELAIITSAQKSTLGKIQTPDTVRIVVGYAALVPGDDGLGGASPMLAQPDYSSRNSSTALIF